MERLEKYIRESISPEWAVSLELISTKEAVPLLWSSIFVTL